MPPLDADYYALLHVDQRADAGTIRAAWAVQQRLWGVRQNAPDLATRHEAERHVQLLGEVKDVLLDPRRRADYDRQRSRPSAPVAARVVPVPVRATEAEPNARVPRGYAAQHPEMVRPLALGLAGGMITGSQVLHWDFALMMAVLGGLGICVYAFDVLGLRAVAWTFRTRSRGIASWVVLVAVTLGFGVRVLANAL